MKKLFQNPLFLLLVFLAGFCGVLATMWLPKGVTNQELLANISKTLDYFEGAASVAGWPWWTPNFNLGHSMADSMGTFFTYLAISAGSAVTGFFSVAGMISGAKIAALAAIILSALGMFFFMRQLNNNPWSALAAAITYATCPQIALRFAYNEHFVVGFCFIYPPLIFWSLLKMAEGKNWRYSLLLAASYAAMALTYVRTAVVFLPLMGAFALWIFITQKKSRPNLIQDTLRAAIIFIPLGLLPLLPILLEMQWMTLFSLDPFSQWQANFTIKTALSWLDRSSVLLSGTPSWFTVGKGGFYLGAVPVLALASFFLWRGKREEWAQSPTGAQLRFFIALGLLAIWFSYGPKSVLQAHLRFLAHAQNVLNIVIPLAWFLFFAQGFIITQLWSRKIPWRRLWIALSILIYFLVPGFLLIEKLPFFNQIRAPWAFWEVGGSFCVAVAAGLCIPMVLRDIFQRPVLRVIAAMALFALLIIDLTPYHNYFKRGELSKGTFDDFRKTQRFLLAQNTPGRVFFISGRYFYLLTPWESGRGLMLEAFHSHFMSKWTRRLIHAAVGSPDLLRAQLNLSGVSYIIIDKRDPDTPQHVQSFYRALFPTVFENSHFAVLHNLESLAPAFTAKEFIAVQPFDNLNLFQQILNFSKFHYASIEQPTIDMSQPGLAGVGSPTRGIELNPEFKNKLGTPFQKHNSSLKRTNFHQIIVENPLPGWLIVPESFHPDWTVRLDGKNAPVFKAFGALLAAKIPEKTQQAAFEFRPPAWYSLALTISLASWFAVACIFLIHRLHRLKRFFEGRNSRK